MATPLPVLIDLNIILDVFGAREPFYEASAKVLGAAELGLIDGYVAAHSLTTLFYLSSRYQSAAVAHAQLTDLLQILKVAAVDAQVIKQALAIAYNDFEDGVQMMAAVHAGCAFVVTRDREGFRSGPLTTLSPGELLALLQESQ